MSYKGKEREWQSYDGGNNAEGDDDGEIIEQQQHRYGSIEQERWDEDGQQEEEEEDGEDDRQAHVKHEQHEEGHDPEGRPPPKDPIPREAWLPKHVLERPKPPTKEEREAEAALLEAQARAGQNTNDPRAKARGKVGVPESACRLTRAGQKQRCGELTVHR